MNAKSINIQSPQELESQLDSIRQNGFSPTLAICMASVKQDLKAISSIFDKNHVHVFGTTTNGEFIDDELQEGTAAILLLELDPKYFHIEIQEFQDANYKETAREIAQKSITKFKNPSYLLSCSGLQTNTESVLEGLKDIHGTGINVFGGNAGDDFNFEKQYVFTNYGMSFNGLITLVFDSDKIEMSGRAVSGWKPLGTTKTVTKSEGNHVFTIDNIPAVDISAKYGGFEVSKENQEFLNELGTNCTLQLIKENGESLMRPGLLVDWNDHSFYCSGAVPQGSKVRFSLPPDFDAIEEVIKTCEELKEEEVPNADAIIYFSCAGRLVAFGPVMSKEIEGVKNVWNVPMVGMFSNAEIGKSKNGNLELHNLTSCCVVLKEKDV